MHWWLLQNILSPGGVFVAEVGGTVDGSFRNPTNQQFIPLFTTVYIYIYPRWLFEISEPSTVSANGFGAKWFGYVGGSCYERDLGYLGVPLESQETGTQVTNLPLLERKTYEKMITRKNRKILPRLKMSPENQWLQRCISYGTSPCN